GTPASSARARRRPRERRPTAPGCSGPAVGLPYRPTAAFGKIGPKRSCPSVCPSSSRSGRPREGRVFVSCSTRCFSREPLESALRHIAELEFDRFELAVTEGGTHLRPSDVAENSEAAAARLRHGPSLTPSALSLDFGTAEAD